MTTPRDLDGNTQSHRGTSQNAGVQNPGNLVVPVGDRFQPRCETTEKSDRMTFSWVAEHPVGDDAQQQT
jgi:hypothetical protein